MRKRQNRVQARLNDQEYAKFLNDVSKTVLKQEGYLRSLIAGKEIPVRQPEEYFEVRSLVSNMANNINQIARVANTCGEVDKGEIQVLLQMIQKCWLHIRNL